MELFLVKLIMYYLASDGMREWSSLLHQFLYLFDKHSQLSCWVRFIPTSSNFPFTMMFLAPVSDQEELALHLVRSVVVYVSRWTNHRAYSVCKQMSTDCIILSHRRGELWRINDHHWSLDSQKKFVGNLVPENCIPFG